jgi:fucose 4-O-acetylase-like acetyltransferase
MKQRQLAPDFIKGISIILMVYGHITPIGHMVAIHQKIFPVIYTFHIPLFLLVSGFFFDFSNNFSQKIIGVLRKIGIPYLIFITLYLLGLLVVQKFGISTIGKPPTTVQDFLITIFYRPFGAYWFLHSLIVIQILLICVWKYLPEKFENKLLAFLLIVLVVFIVFSEIKLIQFRTGLYFLLGIILRKICGDNLNTSFVLVFIFTIILLIFSYPIDGIFSFSIYEVIWCLLLFALLWSFSTSFSNNNVVKFIGWIGQNTLIILLLHILFIMVFKITNPLFYKIDGSGVSYSVIVTASTTGLCILTAYILDKLNLSRFLFGVKTIFSPKK